MNKVLIINLKTRTDRKEACINALKKQGVPDDSIEVYHPLTNRTQAEQNILTEHMIDTHSVRYRTLLNREPLRYFSVTCAHIECLTKASALKQGWCLILEDDWLLNRSWKDVSASMQTLEDQQTAKALAVQLDGNWGHGAIDGFFTTKPDPLKTKIGQFYRTYPVWTCHAYLVNVPAAKQMRTDLVQNALKSFDSTSQCAPDVYMCKALRALGSSWTALPDQSIFLHNDASGSDH